MDRVGALSAHESQNTIAYEILLLEFPGLGIRFRTRDCGIHNHRDTESERTDKEGQGGRERPLSVGSALCLLPSRNTDIEGDTRHLSVRPFPLLLEAKKR